MPMALDQMRILAYPPGIHTLPDLALVIQGSVSSNKRRGSHNSLVVLADKRCCRADPALLVLALARVADAPLARHEDKSLVSNTSWFRRVSRDELPSKSSYISQPVPGASRNLVSGSPLYAPGHATSCGLIKPRVLCPTRRAVGAPPSVWTPTCNRPSTPIPRSRRTCDPYMSSCPRNPSKI